MKILLSMKILSPYIFLHSWAIWGAIPKTCALGVHKPYRTDRAIASNTYLKY